MLGQVPRFYSIANLQPIPPPVNNTNPVHSLPRLGEDPIHFDLNRNPMGGGEHQFYQNNQNNQFAFYGDRKLMNAHKPNFLGRCNLPPRCLNYTPYPMLNPPPCFKTGLTPTERFEYNNTSPQAKQIWPLEQLGDYCSELLNRDKHYWSEEETNLMLELYEENRDHFNDTKTKKTKIWNVIATIVNKRFNTTVNAEQCSQKYRNLKAEFLKVADSSEDGGARKFGSHFPQMRRLLDAEEKCVVRLPASNSQNTDIQATVSASQTVDLHLPVGNSQSNLLHIPINSNSSVTSLHLPVCSSQSNLLPLAVNNLASSKFLISNHSQSNTGWIKEEVIDSNDTNLILETQELKRSECKTSTSSSNVTTPTMVMSVEKDDMRPLTDKSNAKSVKKMAIELQTSMASYLNSQQIPRTNEHHSSPEGFLNNKKTRYGEEQNFSLLLQQALPEHSPTKNKTNDLKRKTKKRHENNTENLLMNKTGSSELHVIFDEYFKSRDRDLKVYIDKQKENIECMNKYMTVFHQVLLQNK